MKNQVISLSEQEQTTLSQAESVIAAGLRSFVDVGTALAEIRDAKLYRMTHTTFADYLKDRWGMTKAHGYRMIKSARFVKDFEVSAKERHIPLPSSERQVRILQQVQDKEQCFSILETAREIAGDQQIAIRHIVEAMSRLQLGDQSQAARAAADIATMNSAASDEVSQILETVIDCLEHRSQCERELNLLRRLKDLMANDSRKSYRERKVGRSHPEIRIKGSNTDYVIHV